MIRALISIVATASGCAALAHGGPSPEEMAFDEQRIAAIIAKSGIEGDVAISGKIGVLSGYKHVGGLPQPYRGGDDGLTWRWASVTKQVIAILVMQQVREGRIDLDAPVATYLADFPSANAATATVRHLLRHRAGLPNPEATAKDTSGVPAFYRSEYDGDRDPVTGYCAGPVSGQPGGSWSYNNCDYLVLGAVLEAVSGKPWFALFQDRIAGPLELETVGAYPGEPFTRSGTIDGAPEPEIDLASYGAAAGLYGSVDDLLAIDKALMAGELLDEAGMAEMWRGDPALGYMALGQWVFDANLKGCDAPIRIVERRGDIGSVQVRNFILPERGIAIVAFSDTKPFEFGEIWTGEGFSFDLLSETACGSKE